MVTSAPKVTVLLASLLLLSCADSSLPVSPPPPPVPFVTISADPSSEGQEGVAGYQLPTPIRVAVRVNGVSAPGVVVHWSTPFGTVSPAVEVTDANGIASAQWTFGPEAGTVTATARISEPAVKRVTFTATAVEEVFVAPVAATQFQSAEVGSPLPRPLQVRVTRDGVPRAGVPVRWTVLGGIITESSVTNTDGIAEAHWTMPSMPGARVARATVRGDRGGPNLFQGTALLGPPGQVVMVAGNTQALPPNADAFRPLTVAVRDRFGNPVVGVPVEWAVETGPVVLVSAQKSTGTSGHSSALVTGTATLPGNAVVTAHVGINLVARFTLTVEPPTDAIILDTDRSVFVSGRNRSTPAVDTVAAGALVTWRLSIFDYDLHAIASLGTPALPGGGEFPYASLSIVQMRFTEPGTYHYTDPYTGATGTLVVR